MNRLDRIMELEMFQNDIGYLFNDPSLLDIALTHSSYANESKHKMQYNERLEFLGDSVLSIIISSYLYNKFPNLPEGSLTKMRAGIVSEPSLAQAARKIDLGKYLLLGNGEQRTGGRERDSILADAMEAVMGAVYLDGGIDKATLFILDILNDNIIDVQQGKGFRDYKTDLQEAIQSHSNNDIKYKIVEEQGPDHNKMFVAQVIYDGCIIGQGKGRSKKEAEQTAAHQALNKILS
ncbi:MAG: ribonuclease III [Xylanivirga thermophila]|jgi:ribonuclease III|uniref:ribonuclease III n=1 Tax=Xylanivirga thermophila TaxID=2496273 RepID=UPI00101B65DD|nr:ribonuclease III [Xylanivirga thermophila]